MSQIPPSRLTSPSSTVDRRPLERCVDELAELARADVESGRFFAELLSRMREFGRAESARLWRQSSEGTWEVAGRLPAEANPGAERDVHEWLTETANQQQTSTRSVRSGDNGRAREVTRTLRLRLTNDRNILTMYSSVDRGVSWRKFDVQMEVSGYHHNVAGDFLSLRPALYAAGRGEVRFSNFVYTVLD